MSKGLFISDERMLELMKYAVQTGISSSDSVFLDDIGAGRYNKAGYEGGTRGFTKEHIAAAAKLTGANLNWVFGFEYNMLRDNKNLDAEQLLEAAVIAVKKELQRKKQR